MSIMFWTYTCRGASLCSGNLHPDAVDSEEQCLRANKKAYYLELQKYHNEYVMFSIGFLTIYI